MAFVANNCPADFHSASIQILDFGLVFGMTGWCKEPPDLSSEALAKEEGRGGAPPSRRARLRWRVDTVRRGGRVVEGARLESV